VQQVSVGRWCASAMRFTYDLAKSYNSIDTLSSKYFKILLAVLEGNRSPFLSSAVLILPGVCPLPARLLRCKLRLAAPTKKACIRLLPCVVGRPLCCCSHCTPLPRHQPEIALELVRTLEACDFISRRGKCQSGHRPHTQSRQRASWTLPRWEPQGIICMESARASRS